MEARRTWFSVYFVPMGVVKSINIRSETKKVEDGYTELSPEDSLLDILTQ